MGVYMNKVREGIKQWAHSPESDNAQSMAGFEDLYNLFMNDDNFTQAVMEGAETIEKSWGFLTEDALTKFVGKIDTIAEENGGSYEPLLAAYQENPDQITAALTQNDLQIVELAYVDYGTEGLLASNDPAPDFNGAIILSSTPNDPVSAGLLQGQILVNAENGQSIQLAQQASHQQSRESYITTAQPTQTLAGI
jgi:hypothetical protein